MSSGNSRRDFLKISAGVAAASMVVPFVHAAESNTIRLALVGCGGRGSGAVNDALQPVNGPVQLYAMADVFEDRLEASYQSLKRHGEKVNVPSDRKFIGFDAYKKAIDVLSPGDVVMLTTPPAFRPLHLEYAVQKGVNVFMEKSFGVDGPGLRRTMKAGQVADQKNLKIGAGLMCRHCPAREQLVDRIRAGELGDLNLLRAYRMHGAVGFMAKGGIKSDLLHQIRNYHNFTWCNGGWYVDWLIHNIDECCWMKGSWPVNAQGMAGRYYRTDPSQILDHYSVEYTFGDGAKLFVQGRHMDGCWEQFASYAHGTKASALITTNGHFAQPKIYKGQVISPENTTWSYDGPGPNTYQIEWEHLISAIRNDRKYNETQRAAEGCLTAVMGRMASHSGQMVTWDQALNSQLSLTPGIDDWSFASAPPVKPGPDGFYPLPQPGKVKEY